MQILTDTLAGMCDIHKITSIRNWYSMSRDMPLGHNFLEFVAVNLYITSDIVIIAALCLKINCFYTIYGSTFFHEVQLWRSGHKSQTTSWILYKPLGILKTIFWLYMKGCGVVVILRFELKSVSLLRGNEMGSIQLT